MRWRCTVTGRHTTRVAPFWDKVIVVTVQREDGATATAQSSLNVEPGDTVDVFERDGYLEIARIGTLADLDSYPRHRRDPDAPVRHERHFRPQPGPRPEFPGRARVGGLRPAIRDERGSRGFTGGTQ